VAAYIRSLLVYVNFHVNFNTAFYDNTLVHQLVNK
jgi:hypothetical protein